MVITKNLCIFALYLRNMSNKKKRIMAKDPNEMRIKLLEELLHQYTEASDRAGMSKRTQEETANRILDKLSELYKKRK